MPSITINDREVADPFRETLDALATGWDPKNKENPGKPPMIEDIYGALRKTYGHEELYQVDAEFILQHCAISWGVLREDLNEDFVEKVYGTLALLLNPLEITQDLSGFINACLLANDQPTQLEDGNLIPSRYIPRMIDAVNQILPDDQDFHEVFWQSNITNFICACYREEDNRILDDTLAYMDDIFFNLLGTVEQADILREIVHNVRNLGREIWDELPKDVEGIEEKIAMIGRDLEAKLPATFKDETFLMTILGKYIVNKAYVKYYRDLR